MTQTAGREIGAGRGPRSWRAAGLVVLLALALAGCDGDAARDAGLKAQQAAQAAADRAVEESRALGEDLRVAGAAIAEEAAGAAEALARFAVDSLADLEAAVEARAADRDAVIEDLQRRLAQLPEQARASLTLHLASLSQRRDAVAARLADLRGATADAWVALVPPLEASLEQLDAAIDRVRERLDEVGAGTAAPTAVPDQLYDVVKVIDGDTIHIERAGEVAKLRLLSVDTEEKLSGGTFDPGKPETVFGEETKLWAQALFAELAGEDGVARVGLAFPGGREEYDVYGRLLCHVILPDGTDFNLKLVEEGWSPYFTKYGFSAICHAEFVAAEARAREAGLGVWNPATNRPADGSAPAAARDYERLVPWWNARAEALAACEERHADNPDTVVSAEVEAQLAAAAERVASSGYPVLVYGPVERHFEEDDGSLTLLFRAPAGSKAFRAHVPKDLRPELAALDLEHRGEPYRQNYLTVMGELAPSSRGFDITIESAAHLQLAGPEPASE